MKLISDIINELVDVDKPLTSPLLKTKVLASRIKNGELLNWVNSELNGYENRSVVPVYRVVWGDISANFINGNKQLTNMALPTSGMPKKVEEAFISMNFTESVEALEVFKEGIKTSKVQKIEMSLSAERISYLEYILKKKNPYLQILSAKKWTSANRVTETLSVIRSKLLDFMLKVEDEFGYITEINELQNKSSAITSIMNTTINNTGDGNVVNTGDKAVIKAIIKISKGNKDELKKELQNALIKEEDINALLEVIDTEKPNNETGTFGAKVNLWIGKMVSKALDGTWQIGIGAAGSFLADAVQAYYGLK